MNQNGIEDENDTFETAFIKRGDFSNVKGRFIILKLSLQTARPSPTTIIGVGNRVYMEID